METSRTFVLFAFAMGSVISGNCPPGWLENKKSCYMFDMCEKLRWWEANRACALKEGGRAFLLLIDNQDEMDFIRTSILSSTELSSENKFWAGSHDVVIDDTWMYAPRDQNMSFFDWGKKEPNNLHQSERCMNIPHHRDFYMNDALCHKKYYAICEFDIEDGFKPENALSDPVITETGCPSDWAEYGGNCYTVLPDPVNWFQAFDSCVRVSNGYANLLTIDSEEEKLYVANEMLRDLLPDNDVNPTVDMSMAGCEMDIWVDGLHLGFCTAAEGWTDTCSVDLESGHPKIVTIKATKFADVTDPGVILSTSRGLITDYQWKCTNVEEQGWETLAFDDSHWLAAAEVTVTTIADLSNINPDAKWIWTPQLDTTVYCRLTPRKSYWSASQRMSIHTNWYNAPDYSSASTFLQVQEDENQDSRCITVDSPDATPVGRNCDYTAFPVCKMPTNAVPAGDEK